MATELAKAYVGIIPSAEGITGNLAKVLEPEAESAGEKSGASLGGLLVSTLKGILTAAALGKALTDTLTEGGALEQSLGGVETLFKDNADTVKAYAQNAWQTAGLSANDYMETVTGFSASLLQGLGGDTATAAEVANMALTDMSDNANKMGTNMQDIQNAYQGFAKQNYTMLDNLKLGYGGTKTEMQRLLADAQKITGVKYDLDNLADVYTAIHVIQGGVDELNGGLGDVNKGLGITGTTALEASTTLAGSLAAMQASFKNVLGALTLGQDLQPSLDALAQSVVTFLTGNLLPDIWNILSALPGALVTFIQALAQTLLDGFGTSFSGGFPQIIENGAALVSNLVQGITANAGQMMESASVSLSAFLAQIVADLPQIITSGGQMLLSLVQGLLAMLPSIIRSAATVIATLLQAIVTHLPEIIAAGFNLVVKLVQGIGNAAPDIIRAAGDACRTLWEAVKNVDWVQLGKDIMAAFETPTPTFADWGRGECGPDGWCLIIPDPRYAETIAQHGQLTWLLTDCDGTGHLWAEDCGQYAIIHGAPGQKFGWMAMAAQRGYEGEYAEPSECNYPAGTPAGVDMAASTAARALDTGASAADDLLTMDTGAKLAVDTLLEDLEDDQP